MEGFIIPLQISTKDLIITGSRSEKQNSDLKWILNPNPNFGAFKSCVLIKAHFIFLFIVCTAVVSSGLHQDQGPSLNKENKTVGGEKVTVHGQVAEQ